MKSQARPLLSQLRGQKLLAVCNHKMICAARDLAEFTKFGLNANYIVSIALKCEEYGKNLHNSMQPTGSDILYRLEEEIQEAITEICETGATIWQNYPKKRRDYEIDYTVQAYASYSRAV
ncbi:MAG: hypothetical protein AAGI38_00505 [Bacteroidota bacterium]